MEYDLNNFEKKESDIIILREIAKNQGFSGRILDFVSEFLAERIETVNIYHPPYSVIKKGIKREMNIIKYLAEKNTETASLSYRRFGKISLGLAGKLNDEKLAEQAKQCFLSAVKCYKKLISTLDEQNEDEREEYTYFSGKCEFFSDNAFQLKEIMSHYYKLQKRTNNLINEVNFKSSINIPYTIDKILDNINDLKGLDPNSIKAQKIKKIIDEDSKFLPKGSYNKIKSLTNKILSNYKN